MRIVSEHARDEVLDSRTSRRTIGNWLHYVTPQGVWAPCDAKLEDAETPPDSWGGAYEFRKGSRRAVLQAHFGDKTDRDAPLVGIRLSARPDCWLNMKALGGDSEVVSSDGGAVWPGYWQDADLSFTPRAHKVEKVIAIHGRTGPRRFQFSLRLAPGHTFAVVDNSLRVYDRDGVEWLHSPAAWGEDADGTRVGVTMTAGDSVTIKGRSYPTVWIELAERDHAEAALPISIDPTVTVSGAAAVEDNFLYAGAADTNYGANVSIGIGSWSGNEECGLWRIAKASIPTGVLTAFRGKFYRQSNASETGSGAFQFFAIKDANTWGCGTDDGGSPIGGSNWNYAKYFSRAWAGSVGCKTSGTDYDADASPPTVNFNAYAAGADVLVSVDLKPAWATAWRDSTRVNNGFKAQITSIGAGVIWYCRSVDNPTNKPYFEVDYSLGGRRKTDPEYSDEMSPHVDKIKGA